MAIKSKNHPVNFKATSLITVIVIFLLSGFSSVGFPYFEEQEPKFNYHSSEEDGIKFRTEDWDKLLELASAEEQLIFLDAYASWCGPCKWMSNNVFTDPEVGKFFNQNFLSVKIDMETGAGPEIASKYGINAYPTLLFMDGNGKMIHRICGALNSEALLIEAKKAITPGMRLIDHIDSFDPNSTDINSFRTMLIKLDQACIDNSKIIDKYFKASMADKDAGQSVVYNQDLWDLIVEYVDNPYSIPIKHVVENHSAYYDKYGVEPVDSKVFDCFVNYYPKVLKQNDETVQDYDSYVHKVSTNNVGQLVRYLELERLKYEGKYEQYGKLAVLYMESFPSDDPTELNKIAWYFYEHVDEFDNLLVAIEWAKKSVELDPAYANLDTLAALYYKIGEKDSALSKAHEAIDFAKSEGIDYSSTEELLTKIESLD